MHPRLLSTLIGRKWADMRSETANPARRSSRDGRCRLAEGDISRMGEVDAVIAAGRCPHRRPLDLVGLTTRSRAVSRAAVARPEIGLTSLRVRPFSVRRV